MNQLKVSNSSDLCCHRPVAVSTNCQLVCFTSLTNSQQLLKGRFCLHISDGSRARRQRYLRKHDILPSSAQCDAEKVVDCRSIPEADSPVILLVRGTADHCVPVCLGTDTNIASDLSRARKQNKTTQLLHRKLYPSPMVHCLQSSQDFIYFVFVVLFFKLKIFPDQQGVSIQKQTTFSLSTESKLKKTAARTEKTCWEYFIWIFFFQNQNIRELT